MKTQTLRAAGALLAAVGLCTAPALAAPPGPLSAVHQFIDNFNRGDAAATKAAHVAAPTITDEVPPHAWSGPGAVDAWLAALKKDSETHGDTNGKVLLGRVLRNDVNGDAAYVVIRATYAYDEHGKAMAEPASMTDALHRQAGAWKIAAWSWNGGTPHAVAAATAKPAAPAAKPAPAKPKT